jgi:WD40 repeat protein
MLKHELKGYTNSVKCTAISRNSQIVATGSYDKSIKFWSATTGQLIYTLEQKHTSSVMCLHFSHDGNLLASGSCDNTTILWKLSDKADGATPTVLRTLKGHTNRVWGIKFSPDDQRLASASNDNTVIIWNVQSGAQLLQYKGHESESFVYSAAWSPDGKLVASGGADKTVRVWAADTAIEVMAPFTGHTGTVSCVVFGTRENFIVSAGADNKIIKWELPKGRKAVMKCSMQGHTSGIHDISLSPDENFVASASASSRCKCKCE